MYFYQVTETRVAAATDKKAYDLNQDKEQLILGFLMMFCTVIITAFSCLMLTAFNKKYTPSQMNSEYYQTTLDSLVATLKTYAAPSHLPEEVFDNLFTITMVIKDSQNSSNAVLGGISYSFDQSDVRKILDQRFQEYVQTVGQDMNSTNLDYLTNLCVKTYEEQVSVPYQPLSRNRQECCLYFWCVMRYLAW